MPIGLRWTGASSSRRRYTGYGSARNSGSNGLNRNSLSAGLSAGPSTRGIVRLRFVEGGRYFEPEVETMPRARLDALQEEKLLGDIVPWAWTRSGLLRAAWCEAGITGDDVKT